MPKIKNYTADLGALPIAGGRRATGADFGSNVGAALEQAGRQGEQQANQFLQQREQEQQRDALIKSTQIQADYAKKADEAAQSGGDMEQLRTQMNNDLAAVGEGFDTRAGQEALDLYTVRANAAFQNDANRISVQRATLKAQQQTNDYLTTASSALARDPSALDFYQKNAETLVDTFNLPPEKRTLALQDLNNRLSVTAAMETARLMPEQAKKWAAEGKWKLTGEQIQQVQAKADQTVRAEHAAAEYDYQAKQRAKKEADEKAASGYYADIARGDTSGTLRDKILNDPSLTLARQEQLIGLMRAYSKDATAPVRTDPSVFNSLRARIDEAPGTPDRITNEQEIWRHFGTDLSKEDASWLAQRFTENKDPTGQTLSQAFNEAVKHLAPQLDKSNLVSIDAGGGARVQQFTVFARQLIDEAIKGNKDPRELLNPESPKYIGKYVSQFQTGAQRLQGKTAATINKALEPRKSLDDIFKGGK